MQTDVQKKVHSVRWFHAFEVVPGVITPGISAFDAKATLDSLGVAQDLRGKRVLDVGTWDGPLAFEMETRGADVYAIDVQDPDCTAFNTAKGLRDSKVKYQQLSVYDVAQVFEEPFDLITYFGVFYHLKYPLAAFEALYKILKPQGDLYFEGEVFVNYSETLDGSASTLDNKVLGESDVPLCLCYPGEYKGASNWFVPNVTCMKGWLEATGFDLTSYGLNLVDSERPYPRQRIIGRAKRAPDLAPIVETAIFEPNLATPANYFTQYQGLNRRRQQRKKASAAAGTTGVTAVAGPPQLPLQRGGALKTFIKRLIRK